MEPIRIVVPWDVALTSDNKTRRMHWRKKGELNRTAKGRARLCWLAAGSPTSSGPVRVSVVTRRGRQMDACNIVGGLKPLIDGIFVDGLTPDDTPKWLTLGCVTQQTGKQWADAPEVEFIVEEMEERGCS